MIGADDGLRLSGVQVRIRSTPSTTGRIIVDDLSLTVAPGRTLAITGPTGSGKSTLLRAIAGAGRLEAGRIELDGDPVDPARVGILTQSHELIGGLTAAENVATRLLARGPMAGRAWHGIEARLKALLLPEASWHNLVEQLSGGQQQRVAVARALVGEPRLVCLDDPTSELDAATGEAVWAAIEEATARGAVVVVATPDADEVARCDSVLRVGAARRCSGERPAPA